MGEHVWDIYIEEFYTCIIKGIISTTSEEWRLKRPMNLQQQWPEMFKNNV
jgi:hypothetical protein